MASTTTMQSSASNVFNKVHQTASLMSKAHAIYKVGRAALPVMARMGGAALSLL